jgi:nucleoside-diphosphate-sugar epimerase
MYKVLKANFDEVSRCAARSTGIEVSILRPSNVYGPKMPNHSIRSIMNIIRKGLIGFIRPCGASANYFHVNDVLEALYLGVSNSRAANQIYIVSVWATMEDMVSGLAWGSWAWIMPTIS